MFGQNKGGGSGDDRQDGPPMPIPEVPAMRTFKVTKSFGLDNLDAEDPNSETFEVRAHEAEINAAGNILRFRQYAIHPQEGPTNTVVRCIMRPANAWLEYEEILPEPSLIHTDVSGGMLGSPSRLIS
jgi:hypothetical protein